MYIVMTRQLLTTKILKMNIDNYYKELEGILLNKVLYCSKNITDIDLQEIIKEGDVILVKLVTCGSIREDLQYIECNFWTFLNGLKYFKVYIDGSHIALAAFIKTTFHDVNVLYRITMFNED